MGKTRVGVLLRENLGGSKSANRSADLISLSQKYAAWTKKLRALIVALEKYHQSIGIVKGTRAAVSVSSSKDSPSWCGFGLFGLLMTIELGSTKVIQRQRSEPNHGNRCW